MTLSGRVLDADSREPVPGATVELWVANVMLKRIAANENGDFLISSSSEPDRLRVSSAEFVTTQWPLPEYEEMGIFTVKRDIQSGGEVILTSFIQKNKGLLIVGLLALLLLTKKR